MSTRKLNPKPKVAMTINATKARLRGTSASAPSSTTAISSNALTPQQVIMLEVLQKSGGVELPLAAFESACAAATHEPFSRRMYSALRVAKYISAEFVSTDGLPRMLGLTISATGRRALWKHLASADHTACIGFTPPRTFATTTPYTPPANVYQRNYGHPHIASHGVRC